MLNVKHILQNSVFLIVPQIPSLSLPSHLFLLDQVSQELEMLSVQLVFPFIHKICNILIVPHK